MKSLTIVTPVYQEATIIADFYREVKAELNKLEGYHATMLFVVDRGDDDTLDILKRIAIQDPAVRVIGMSSRFGHQMSLLAGIDHAEPGIVIMMDSDLQHPPALIPELIKGYEEGYDIVNAIRENTERIGLFKKGTSRLFYWTMNRISTVALNENAPDFRLLSGRVARILREDIRERNVFLRGMIGWLGFNQKFIRFVAAARTGGESKYSVSRLLNLGLSGIVSFSRRPLRFIFSFGVLCFSLAVLFGIFIGVRFFVSGVPISLFLIGTETLLLFFGIQCIFLGIVGEYIGAIFEEVKARPHYIIEEKINFS